MVTNKQAFLRKHRLSPDASLSLGEISRLSGFPRPALQEVFDRGIGAWKTNIASVRLKRDFSKNPDVRRFPRGARLGKEQWAYARVYSFVQKTDSDFYGADRYIAEKYGLLPARLKNTKAASR